MTNQQPTQTQTIDTMEEASLQDLVLAQAFGISQKEVEAMSLHQMKNKMHNLAFDYRYKNIDISAERAKELNERLEEIILKLEEVSDYDAGVDFIMDFNNYVVGHPYYHRFCW